MTGETNNEDETLSELIDEIVNEWKNDDGPGHDDINTLAEALRAAIHQRNSWMDIAFAGKEHEESVVEDDLVLMNILKGDAE